MRIRRIYSIYLVRVVLTTVTCIYFFCAISSYWRPVYETSVEKGIRPLEISASWELGWKAWKEEQERRKAVVRNVCQEGSLQVQSRRDKYKQLVMKEKKKLNFVLVSDEYKTMYCSIPKVGHTSWKLMWMNITNTNDSYVVYRGQSKIHGDITKKMKLLTQNNTDEELVRKLESYTKVIVIRHPIERLLSAYINRVHYIEGKSGFQREVLKFVQTQRQNATHTTIQWPEFISFVASPNGRQNDHWRPYEGICHPCDIDYDVIVKFETLTEDAERFLRLIQLPAYLHFGQRERVADTSFLDSYLHQLTSKQMAGIYKYFGRDFDMFEYDK